MKLSIQDSDLVAAQLTSVQYVTIRGWNMMRWDRSAQAMRGKLCRELLEHFRNFGGLPAEIENVFQSLCRKEQELADERNTSDPKPLIAYPVKVNLFTHQIRGANMALLTFGWDREKCDFDD